MKKALLIVLLVLIATLAFAQTPAHPNWVSFERTGPTTGVIRWSSEPSFNVGYYYFGLHSTTTQYFAPSYCDPDWNVPGGYIWEMVAGAPGSFMKEVNALDPGLDYYAYVAAAETGGWTWSAYSSWEPDLTLPVELSSFAATLTAQRFVSLRWTTQSELDLQGYRVYRNSTENLANSILLTTNLIPATNTSTMVNYAFEDHEVEAGNTYWYWLESVENNSQSNIHGPVTVTLTEGVTPPTVEISSLGGLYPNPFRQGSQLNLEATVKMDESATLSIYNARGQIVKTFSLGFGTHQLRWNGKDDSGQDCGSGIYFARLNTPSMVQTKKLMIIR